MTIKIQLLNFFIRYRFLGSTYKAKNSNVKTPLSDDCSKCREMVPSVETPKLPKLTKSTVKITPPLCSCGRRCKRKKVMNPGRNIDRIFYTCPLQSADKTDKKGCKYFKWEEKLLKENQARSEKLDFNENTAGTVLPLKRAKPDVNIAQCGTVKTRQALKDICVNLFNP